MPQRKSLVPQKAEHSVRGEKYFYSREEAAFALALSIRAIDHMIADTRLRTRRFGRRVLIPAEDLRAVAAEILKNDMLQGTGQAGTKRAQVRAPTGAGADVCPES